MVQIQIVIHFPLDNKNEIVINELAREDATAHEREVASAFYGVLRDMILAVREEVGADQMEIAEMSWSRASAGGREGEDAR